MNEQEGTIPIHAAEHSGPDVASQVGQLVAEMLKGPMPKGGAVKVHVAIEHDPQAKVSA